MRRVDGVVTGIVIGHQSPLEVLPEDGDGHIAGTGGIHEKEAEVRCAGIPEVGGLSIQAPTGFIAMNDIGGARLVAEHFVERFGGLGGGVMEGHSGGGNQGHGEEVAKDLSDIAKREFEGVAKVDGHGFGEGPDLTVS